MKGVGFTWYCNKLGGSAITCKSVNLNDHNSRRPNTEGCIASSKGKTGTLQMQRLEGVDEPSTSH